MSWVMVSIKILREIALSFPEVTEEPHFEKISFRVRKKIFATYDDIHQRVCLKLSEIDQDVFSSIDRTIIYPVANKWGKQGWTIIEMSKIQKKLFIDVLHASYAVVAPKTLSAQLNNNIK